MQRSVQMPCWNYSTVLFAGCSGKSARKVISVPSACLKSFTSFPNFFLYSVIGISRPQGSCMFIKRQNLVLNVNWDPLTALMIVRMGREGSFCVSLSTCSLFNHRLPHVIQTILSSVSLGCSAAVSKRNFEWSELASWHLGSHLSLCLTEPPGRLI